MLHFLSMTIENFGPYKGVKEIDFTSQAGVSIFWGDNGRGKTTLLNAFRYALFEQIERRYGPLATLREMENIESRKEGIFGFSIVIKMRKEENVYELTRKFKPKDNVLVPEKDLDYKKEFFIKKNGAFLSPEESKHTINTLMPKTVSRFFLFDGELLQEYEDLVLDTMNSNIRDAIEQILGVPVLKYGMTDLEAIAKKFNDEMMQLAQKGAKSQKLSAQLQGINVNISMIKNSIDKHRQDLKVLTLERKKICEACEKTEQLREWIIEREKNEEKIKSLMTKEKETYDEIRKISEVAWKCLLEDSLDKWINDWSNIVDGLESKRQNSYVAEIILEDFKKAIDDKICPTCLQSVDNDVLKLLNLKRDDWKQKFKGLTPEESDTLDMLKIQVSSLRKIKISNKKELLKKCEDDLYQIDVEKTDIQSKVKELNEKINSHKGESVEIKELPEKLRKIEYKIATKEQALQEDIKSLEERELVKHELEGQIKKHMVGEEAMIASKKSVLCENVKKIFEQGKERYCQRLKENVERDADELFRSFANDKEYKGLRINDNYGLNIILKNGDIVPGRSAGYEHIVALALIGALHKNAPLQGPIIMDSPFGRLDPTHKSNIVKALPHMAEQVILLVYTNEIDQQTTRETLGCSLLSEKKLSYISSTHTDIV